MASKVLVCVHSGISSFCREEIEPLISSGFEVHSKHLWHTQNEADVSAAVRGYDYVIAGSEKWGETVFNNVCGGLKMLVRFGVGMESVDVGAATRLGVPVSNAPGSNAAAVAEHALALILCLARNIVKYDSEIREGVWNTRLTPSLSGRVGIVGFGAAGRELSALLKPFPVEIAAYDIATDETAARNCGVRYVDLDDLAGSSDFISLHIPVTDGTRGLVDKKFLTSMKPTAYLINTSRGAIIDEHALAEALERNIIAGAALDVFADEPLPVSSPFTRLDNTILTPHCASASFGGFKSTLARCVNNILDFEAGRPFPGLVNPDYANHI